MNVKLITPQDHIFENIMDQIAYMARVSNPANQANTDTNEKLLRYLIKHKHWSPFEMQSICLEIDTTRDIARQILRHRSFSFQEFSQRYADPESMGYPFELRQARIQDETNRQNSIELDPEMDGHAVLQGQWVNYQKRVIDAAESAYKWAIDKGIAKEQARAVLPEGNTKSRMYMNGTVRSWMHYIDLRTTPGTQKEHMEVARACAYAINPVFPMIKEFVHGQDQDNSLSGSVRGKTPEAKSGFAKRIRSIKVRAESRVDEISDKEREKLEKINSRNESRKRRKVPALWRDAVIPSPCIGTCTYDPFREPTVCMGCERTYDEISMWETYGDEERQKVLDRIAND